MIIGEIILYLHLQDIMYHMRDLQWVQARAAANLFAPSFSCPSLH